MAHREKYERLVELIQPLNSVLVAYSGGVDSSFLLKVAADVLTPRNVIAFIASSPLNLPAEIDDATALARSLGVEAIVDEVSPLEDDRFCANDRERCYVCKARMLSAAWNRAREKGVLHVLEGSNADDGQDFRPGNRAVMEQGALSPLGAVGLSKAEIRLLSKEFGLKTHDKPSDACLATRIPYGTLITGDLIARIAHAEDFLRQEAGVRQVRVRAHGGVARIEVAEGEIGGLIEKRIEIAEGLKRWGFIYVAVDLEGYRTGSMNKQENAGTE